MPIFLYEKLLNYDTYQFCVNSLQYIMLELKALKKRGGGGELFKERFSKILDKNED